MNRRRFLFLSAAALVPVRGFGESISEWQGRGLGTALSLRLAGASPHLARQTFARVEAEIARIESLASLFQDSALTRLNRDGRLAWPSPDILDLLSTVDRVHDATGGAFDPTVQPLWTALATGGAVDEAQSLIGWKRVRLSKEEIRLDAGQALTLNGIAQGWAADRIAALLRMQGFGNALIDMGEISALGQGALGGWPIKIAGPDGVTDGQVQLVDRAIATSSPLGTVIGKGKGHILGPRGQSPLWRTVSVSADSGAIADALSTAFCLMDHDEIHIALKAFPSARVEVLV